jgi:hypothetical protein
VNTIPTRTERNKKDMTSKIAIQTFALALIVIIAPAIAMATGSTTFWAVSTANCQARGVPHVTYDTYFGKGPTAGSAGAPNYPVDSGLTIGFLPFEKIQGEAGFDVLLPSRDPLFFNAKLCTPESSLFRGSPAVSFGIYTVGTKKDVTDYNVLHLMFQKAIPGGGYVAAGGYHGLNRTLLTSSDGGVVQNGAMLAVFSPTINVGLTGLKKINLAADVQTGKNVLGAWGGGSYFYFTDTVSLLVGPVFSWIKTCNRAAEAIFGRYNSISIFHCINECMML